MRPGEFVHVPVRRIDATVDRLPLHFFPIWVSIDSRQ